MESTKKQKIVWDGYEIALKRYEKADYEGALTLLLNADEDGHATPEILSLIATIYFDIEMYNYSIEYWLRYLSAVSGAENKAKAYNALAACYCRLDMPGPMTYWYDEQLKVCDMSELEYDNILMEYYDAVNDTVHSEFYSVDNPPGDRLAWEGSVLISEGCYSEAVEKLKAVSINDPRYIDAQLNISACYSVLGEEEKSIDVLKALVEKRPDSGVANLSYAACFFDAHQMTEAKFYAEKAVECGIDDEEDLFRLAFILLNLDEEEQALHEIDKSLLISPYYLKSLLLKGEILYNRGNFEEAEQIFKKLYDITRGPTAKYFYSLSVSTQNDKPTKLEYGMILPKNEASLRFTHVAFIIAGREAVIKAEKKEDLKDLVDWCLFYPNGLQADFVKTLISCSKKMSKYLIDKLLCPRVDCEVKFVIIEGLARYGYSKKIAVEMNGVYFTKKIIPTDLGADLPVNVFDDAYAYAYSKICLFDERADDLIDYAREMFYYTLENHTFDKVKDKNALAAAMLFFGEYDVVKQKGFVEQILKSNRKKVKEVLLYTGGSKE